MAQRFFHQLRLRLYTTHHTRPDIRPDIRPNIRPYISSYTQVCANGGCCKCNLFDGFHAALQGVQPLA